MISINAARGLRAKLIRSHRQVALMGIAALIVALGVLLWLRSRTLTLIEVRQPTAQASILARGGVQQSLAALRGWMLLSTPEFKADRQRAWDEEIDPAIARLRELSPYWIEQENHARLKRIRALMQDLRAVQLRIEETNQAPGEGLANRWLSNEAVPAANEIDTLLSQMAGSQQLLMENERHIVEWLGNFAVAIGVILIGGLTLAARRTARRNSDQLMEPIGALATGTNMFAEGELHEDIPVVSDDELGDLTKSFNAMRAKLESHEADLLRSNEELQRFAYVASHDLQAPLRAVSGFVQLIYAAHGDRFDEQGVDWIKRAIKATAKMQTLIEDLLSYSRIESQSRPFKELPFADAATDALEMLQRPIEEAGADVQVGPLPTLNADRSQIVQLLQNLIGNGVKYHRGDQKPKIEVSAKERDAHWEFSIRDNGIGIAEEHRDGVFEVFQRLHGGKEFSGTGIGLSVCRRVVERHGGSIWVADPPKDGGSDFRFTISSILQQSEQP